MLYECPVLLPTRAWVAICDCHQSVAATGSVMKKLSSMLLALAALAAAGCAGGVETVAPTVDVTGKWAGTWVMTTTWGVLGYQQGGVGSGSIQMTLTQTGSEYTGTLLATGPPVNPSRPTQGIVSGNQARVMQFPLLPICVGGDMTGMLTVQGDSMTGTVRCGRLPGSHDRGAFEANVTLTRQK